MGAVEDASVTVRAAIASAGRGLVEREVLVELVALAAVASEHLLVVGPPGTAKSEAARRAARAFDARYFEYLLGRFTEPSELFGPVDLRKLREGVVETATTGMLPEAEIAFLDEIFLGSTAILNSLLTILNERTFRRGHTSMIVPLRVCVAASNRLPDDDALAAFADRFLLRTFVEPVGDALLEDLLEQGDSLTVFGDTKTASLASLDLLANAARTADLTAVRATLAHAVRLLRRAGITLSDRRVVKAQRVVAAAAALAGRSAAQPADLWPLVFVVPTAEGQTLAREVLHEVLAGAESASLPAAALDAARGPRARATRIVETGAALLSARPDGSDGAALDTWRLKLEAVAREIDASFAAEQLTDELRALRQRIVEGTTGLSA